MTNENFEQRINELEIRISFQDSTLAALDSVVRRQQDEIDNLKQQLEKLQSLQQDPGQVEATHEKPPHY